MTELPCVRCNTPLQPLELEGQLVVACRAGHGIWLGRSQLASLVEDDTDDASPSAETSAWAASDTSPVEMTTERFRSCPECGKTLRKDNWKYGSSVVVDTCDEHGIWVDAGEVESIEAWTEAWHAHSQ